MYTSKTVFKKKRKGIVDIKLRLSVLLRGLIRKNTQVVLLIFVIL